MEGGLLVHAAWLLSFTFIAVYRRWFETVAPRDAAFESFCAQRPTLAVVHVSAGAEATVTELLRGSIGRGEVIATLGGWPWVHYVLRVRAECERGAVLLRIQSCRVLRSREVRPPALVALLGELERATDAVREVWLHSGAYVDVSGRTSAPRGWHLRGRGTGRPALIPATATPPESEPASATASPTRMSPLAPVLLGESAR